jgi:tripartite-type tricarboxylate transporter receptor subunit TctC
MTPSIPRRAALGLLAAATGALALPALAQTYPAKVVTIVVPFGAGNAYDVMVRALAEQLRQATGQAFIVEAKQGALGGIASSAVARAAPDGYTILFGANSTHAANVHLFKKLPYDPVADFTPITTVARIPQVLLVSPALQARDLKELIALAKSQPGKFNFGSSSATGRVASEQFRQSAGIDAVHVPYKTTSQALTDLIGGQLHFMIADAGAGIAQAQGGKVRALAVTSAQRLPAAADIPTMSEAGLPGYEFTAWLALFAPARTPPEVVKRLSDLTNTILRSPAMRDQLARLYAEPYPGDPEALRQLVEVDTVRWGRMIKAAGIEAE